MPTPAIDNMLANRANALPQELLATPGAERVKQFDGLAATEAVGFVFRQPRPRSRLTNRLDPGGQLSTIDPDVASTIALMRQAAIEPFADRSGRHAKFSFQITRCVPHRQRTGRTNNQRGLRTQISTFVFSQVSQSGHFVRFE